MWRKPEENKSVSAAQPMSTSSVSTPTVEMPREVAVTPPPAPPSIAYSPVLPAPPAPNPTAQPAGRISRTLAIKGEITGSDDLFIDGDIAGKISIAEGRVTVAVNGRVTADIVAREIVVQGNVQGKLYGRERVEIGSTGCARGDVLTRRFVVEDGAEIHGHVEIGPAESPSREAAARKDGAANAKFAAPAGEKAKATPVDGRELRPLV